ncbi:MAG: hypothetical protein ACRDVC_00305 [Acidimicrobiales bacterium]
MSARISSRGPRLQTLAFISPPTIRYVVRAQGGVTSRDSVVVGTAVVTTSIEVTTFTAPRQWDPGDVSAD